MDNKKTDSYYIGKIIENIDFIFLHTNNLSIEDITNDELLLDSIMFRFIQISENVKKLSDEYKNSKKYIPWIQMAGIRNKIVHAYDTIRVDIVYETIKNDLPYLKEELIK